MPAKGGKRAWPTVPLLGPPRYSGWPSYLSPPCYLGPPGRFLAAKSSASGTVSGPVWPHDSDDSDDTDDSDDQTTLFNDRITLSNMFWIALFFCIAIFVAFQLHHGAMF